MSLRFAAALLTLLLLAFPASALAQSAGDEQYADPFGEVPSDDDSGNGPEPSDGADTPTTSDTPSETVVQETAPATGAKSTESAPGAALPRSGMPLGLLAGAGALLAAGGFTLRRRA